MVAKKVVAAVTAKPKPAEIVKAPASKPAATKVPAKPVEPPVAAKAAPVVKPPAVAPIPVLAAPVVEAAADVAASIEPASSTLIDSVQTAKEDIIMDATTATNAAAEKTQAMFAEANDRTKGAVEKGTKFFQEMTEFSKGNVEAMVESSKIAAKGLESMGQDAAAYAKTSFESASEALRTMASIKSPTEFMKFQSDYVRSIFDGMVAQTSRGTEASLKLVGEVAQPISNRVAMAADKMKVVA
ncbi:hypothetical protein ASG67_14545 [Sphingomonas sp. Leaf339]|nr:hypothetical protein ASG67_14545 [Sphingomonas sp. Leaf339]